MSPNKPETLRKLTHLGKYKTSLPQDQAERNRTPLWTRALYLIPALRKAHYAEEEVGSEEFTVCRCLGIPRC